MDHTQILSRGSADGSTGYAHPSRPSHGRLHRPDTCLDQQVSAAQATLHPVESSGPSPLPLQVIGDI